MTMRRRKPVSSQDTSPPETIPDPVGEVAEPASQSTRTGPELGQEDQGEDHADSTAPLTERQRRFAEEYLVDGIGAQAAIRAGYSPNGADVTAARLLGNDRVRALVRAGQAARSRRLEITADRVLLELARLAFGDMRELASWSPDGLTLIDSLELSDGAAAAVAEIKETRTQAGTTLTVKRYDKPKALELLCRHLGLLEQQQSDPQAEAMGDLRAILAAALQRAARARGPGPTVIEAAAVPVEPAE